MASGFQNVSLPAGEILFHEGDFGDCAYLVRSGTMQIAVKRDAGLVELARLGPGEILGEMAIIVAGQRAATAVAAEDAVLEKIDAEQFSRRVEGLDPVMRLCVDLLLTRLRDTLKRVGTTLEASDDRAVPRGPDATRALAFIRGEEDLANALRRGQLQLRYQPIVRLWTGKLAGFSAVLQWHHPERGVLDAREFMATAIASGLIRKITQRSLAKVCRDVAAFRLACLKNIAEVETTFVNVAVTAADLDDPAFAEHLRVRLGEHGLGGDAVTIAAPDDAGLAARPHISKTMTALRDAGIGIGIDAFGKATGSLLHLATMPLTALHAGAGLTEPQFPGDGGAGNTLAKAFFRFAEAIDLPTLASGIETWEDARALSENGCTFGTGDAFGPPLQAEEAVALLTDWVSSSAESEVCDSPEAQQKSA